MRVVACCGYVPKVLDVVAVVPTACQFVWFATLKASPRSWNTTLSKILKLRNKPDIQAIEARTVDHATLLVANAIAVWQGERQTPCD